MCIDGHQIDNLSHGGLLLRRVRHPQRLPVDSASEGGSYPHAYQIHAHEVVGEQQGLYGGAREQGDGVKVSLPDRLAAFHETYEKPGQQNCIHLYWF